MKPLSSALLLFALVSAPAAEPPATPVLVPPAKDASKLTDPAAAEDNSPPATPPERAVSREMAAKIGATLPKYSPPKPEQKAEEQPDLREVDKPKNGIIRLPQHIVQETKMPAMKERDLLTPQGKLNLAYQRHPGLRFGSLPFLSNNGIALFMLEEELRLERKAEMEDLTDLYRYSDPKTGDAMKRVTEKSFIRTDSP